MSDDATERPQPGDSSDLPDESPQSTGWLPDFDSVRNFMLYSASLPERTLRSGASVVGGALRESTSLLVPQAFQESKTYSVFVAQMLDFMVENVGGVERDEDDESEPQVENYVARKTVGNFIELAGMATFHLSPLTLLAVVSDVAYGSQAYLRELSVELKRKGVIDENSTIDHVDDLLEAVAAASSTTASAFDTPPLSVEGLKQTVEETRKAVAAIDPTKILPQAEMERLWNDIHEVATAQGVDPLAISGAMTLYSLDKIGSLGQGALSTVTAAGTLFNRHVIDHYTTALTDVRQKGIYQSLAESSRPYVNAVWTNYSSENTTITEDVLSGKLLGSAWKSARRWLGGSE